MNSCCSDDCPVKYGWCPPQIDAETKEFTTSLNDLRSIFNLALERYKETFPPRIVDPTEENISLYQESKNKLALPLKPGSTIFSNNYFWLHGRKPFKKDVNLSSELLRIRGIFSDSH